jgi:legumain
MRGLLLTTFLVVAACALIPRRNFRAPRAGNGETWALLVAGSNGWYNYRHQADTAHAYQVLKNHGIPADRIIVMMYDDVVNSTSNPYPGKLFNRPHGEDVYAGLKIDYKTKTVTPENFLNVLKGNKQAMKGIGNGRVIESTPDDRVFVYFTDHGSPGLVAFPDDILTVQSFIDTLEWLHDNKRYGQLVFYLESCESGSMFDKVLRDDINIYAITAANGRESSWGTYCDNDQNLPCLGDLFSVNWMNDSDKEDIDVETLDDQYQLVKKQTTKSHVMHFGNLSIAKEPVGWFQGAKRLGKNKRVNYMDDFHSKQATWPSRDIELFSLMQKKRQTNDLSESKSLSHRISRIHKMRKWVKTVYHDIVDQLLEDGTDKKRMFIERGPIIDMACHHHVVHAFDSGCMKLSKFPFGLKYVHVLNNLCNEFEEADAVIDGIIDACMFREDRQQFDQDLPFY